jgi:hypothetical protein
MKRKVGSPLARQVAAWALGATAVLGIGAVQAAPTVWRCGNSYSEQPCPQGKAIETEDAPSAERRREADEATRRDLAAAESMQRERLRREAQPPRQAVLIGMPAQRATPGKTADTPPKAKKPRAGPKDFTASYATPGEKKEKKKAKREAAS